MVICKKYFMRLMTKDTGLHPCLWYAVRSGLVEVSVGCRSSYVCKKIKQTKTEKER